VHHYREQERANGRRVELPAGALVSRIGGGLLELIQKEVELARAELASQARAGQSALVKLAAAAVATLAGLNLLLMAGVLALATVMPGWLAALVVAVVVFGAGAIVGYAGWSRRPRAPLVLTRKSLKEDWEWLKHQLV